MVLMHCLFKRDITFISLVFILIFGEMVKEPEPHRIHVNQCTR
jgi:hypothetical protein